MLLCTRHVYGEFASVWGENTLCHSWAIGLLAPKSPVETSAAMTNDNQGPWVPQGSLTCVPWEEVPSRALPVRIDHAKERSAPSYERGCKGCCPAEEIAVVSRARA